MSDSSRSYRSAQTWRPVCASISWPVILMRLPGLTASTGLANSTRKPSPVVLTIRPWCSSSSARPKSGPCKRSLKAEFHVSELDWLALQHLKIVEDRPAGGDHQRGPARASAPLGDGVTAAHAMLMHSPLAPGAQAATRLLLLTVRGQTSRG